MKNSIVYYLFLLFIILNYSGAIAQNNENTFQRIYIEIDGEEVFDVHVITQDQQGYLWMSTNLGLIRYNGLEGKKYDFKRNDSSAIANDYITSLYNDNLGELWIGANSGLSKYEPDCDCLIKYPTKINNINLTEIQSITEDKNGNLWLGTQEGRLFRYERESDEFTRILYKNSDAKSLINENIYHLLADQNNDLWIGTNSGLLRYNISTEKVERFANDPANSNSLLDDRISALYEDDQGQILIGTFKCGFHIYDTKNDTLNRISYIKDSPNDLHAPNTKEKVFGNDPYVNLIHQDKNGGYWIGTTGKGINYFNSRTDTFKNYSFDLVNPQILSSIFEDRQANIWIGGYMGSGLFRSDLFVRKYNLNTNYTSVEVTYESSLNPGILWVTSQEAGLIKMDLTTGKTKKYLHNEDINNSIGHNWIRSVYQENQNTLWVGLGNGGAYGDQAGNGGVDRMDLENETFTHYKLMREDDGLEDFSYTPYNIFEDKERQLWLSTGPGGIFRSDKEKKEFKPVNILKDNNLPVDIFFNIARIDSNGDIWASDFAGSGTLYLYDRQKDIFKKYLDGFKMYNLLVDKKGWLLISTWEKGLVHFNPIDGSFIQYTKKEGLPSDDALDIVENRENNFWIGTRMGPAKFNAETGKITSLGFPIIRYNRGITLASDNQIYLGANKGLVSFNPDQVLGNPYAPEVAISEMLISEENYLLSRENSEELIFSHKQNDIAFKYVGLHYSNPEKNSYRYKLEPVDEEWINAGNERTVRFANLSPGTYSFRVKSANSDGVWSEKAAVIPFTILSPWWTTWWAYTLYIAVFVLLTYRVYRFQLSKRMAVSESNRLKEVNRFKNNLITNITHEFRTPLTVIKGMANTIKSNLKFKKINDIDKSLEMVERNSDNLLNLVNEMLDLAKIESGNMELQLIQADVIPFLKYVSESFGSLAEESRINLTVYSEADSLLMDFDANKLTSIVSNLLSNAIKFTSENGKIIVHINQIKQKGKSFLFLKIKDNGRGIDKEELPNIFNRFYQTDPSFVRGNEGTGIGLALTKELVDLMHGTVEVVSSPSMGSEFMVKIPVARRSPRSEPNKNIRTRTSVSKSRSTRTKQTIEIDSELPLALIIEDNMDVVYYLNSCLENKYETLHAVNGIMGIEMAFEKIPDIIISDIMMPGKDGFEVCKTLRGDERTNHIPIVILTAKVNFEDKLKGLRLGADAYLSKPFIKEELFTRLAQLVINRKKLISKIQKEGSFGLLKKNTKDPRLQFLQKIIKLIHEDISDSKFGSEELAKKLLVSESQIYRKIKAITGKSTAIYIRSIRLQYAKDLLINTDKSVSEVAYEVGFNDPSWFSRAFKEKFGFTPSSVSK